MSNTYVLVEVRNGIAEVTRTAGEVEVLIIDWDDIKAGDSLDESILAHPVFGPWVDADRS